MAAALLAWTAAYFPSAQSLAGASAYDLNIFLDEPHPFANAPAALPDAGTPLYGSQIRVPARFPQPSPGGAAAARPAAEPSLVDRLGLTAAAPAPAYSSDDPAFLTLAAGYYDFNDNEGAAEFRLEWHGRKLFWEVKPLAGVMMTSDAAFYGYGGILFDLYFGRRIVVSPSFAAGYYADGGGKDLGSAIEFRSALEVGWRFDDRSRLSAMVYHISNAGIDDNNPGTEVFSIGYSFPLY